MFRGFKKKPYYKTLHMVRYNVNKYTPSPRLKIKILLIACISFAIIIGLTKLGYKRYKYIATHPETGLQIHLVESGLSVQKYLENQSLPPKVGDKIVWTFWDKGWDGIPEFGKVCLDLMHKLNPNAKLILVTNSNLNQILKLGQDLPHDFFDYSWRCPQWRSDMIRGTLLSKYGGIWIDPTTIFYESMDVLWNILDEYDEQNTGIQSFGIGGNFFFVTKPNVTFFNRWAQRARSKFEFYKQQAILRGDKALRPVNETMFWERIIGEYYVFSFDHHLTAEEKIDSGYDSSRSRDPKSKYDLTKLRNKLGLDLAPGGLVTYTNGDNRYPMIVKVCDGASIPNFPFVHSVSYWYDKIADKALFDFI